MNLDHLISARQLAEQAVNDVQDRDLKLRAFEVILSALLHASPITQTTNSGDIAGTKREGQVSNNSLASRILQLVGDGFFFEQRSLPEIQTKLAEYGWHYPQTNLSTPLMRMVQQRKLRRTQIAEGTKRLWKYSNP